MSLVKVELFANLMSIISIVFTIVFLIADIAMSAELRQNVYRRITDPSFGLSSPTTSFPEHALIECASKCSSTSNCQSFLWDPSTKRCTTGSMAVVSGDVPATAAEVLYAIPRSCRLDLGYGLYLLDATTSMCVYVEVNGAEDYDTAQYKCTTDGGRLVKTNSVVKVNLIIELIENNGGDFNTRVRVGLDDINTEDQFVWLDGQIMTTAERTELFGTGQPDNGMNDEHCVEIDVYNGCLDDKSCDSPIGYACEMVL